VLYPSGGFRHPPHEVFSVGALRGLSFGFAPCQFADTQARQTPDRVLIGLDGFRWDYLVNTIRLLFPKMARKRSAGRAHGCRASVVTFPIIYCLGHPACDRSTRLS